MARTVKVGSSGGAPPLSLTIKVTGVDKTSDGFKEVRRDINTRLRNAQQTVGQRVVLPVMRARMSAAIGSRWADSLQVKRDRLDVFVGSSLRGPQNRALGWLDFGGKRPRDHTRRVGPLIMVKTLQSKQSEIRDQIHAAVLDEFRDAGFDT